MSLFKTISPFLYRVGYPCLPIQLHFAKFFSLSPIFLLSLIHSCSIFFRKRLCCSLISTVYLLLSSSYTFFPNSSFFVYLYTLPSPISLSFELTSNKHIRFILLRQWTLTCGHEVTQCTAFYPSFCTPDLHQSPTVCQTDKMSTVYSSWCRLSLNPSPRKIFQKSTISTYNVHVQN